MKKIMQTKFGKKGNCLAACIATLLNVEINDIPDHNTDEWCKKINEYLVKNHNLYLLPLTFSEKGYDFKLLEKSYLIVGGHTSREESLLHAIICKDGKLFHDPHPHGIGLKTIKIYYLLMKYFKD